MKEVGIRYTPINLKEICLKFLDTFHRDSKFLHYTQLTTL